MSGQVERTAGSERQPPEEVLWPELEIVDCHHHLWHRDTVYLFEDYLKRLASGASEEERADLFHRTARRVYRVPDL